MELRRLPIPSALGRQAQRRTLPVPCWAPLVSRWTVLLLVFSRSLRSRSSKSLECRSSAARHEPGASNGPISLSPRRLLQWLKQEENQPRSFTSTTWYIQKHMHRIGQGNNGMDFSVDSLAVLVVGAAPACGRRAQSSRAHIRIGT